jgi:hypothetical protein
MPAAGPASAQAHSQPRWRCTALEDPAEMIERWIRWFLPDPVDAELTVEARSGAFDHVAAPAQRLHRAIGHPARHLRRVQLRHRDLSVHDLPVLERIERVRGVV